MKKTFTLLAALIIIFSGSHFSSIAQIITYSVTGTHTYTVPVGVTALNVDMQGGKGGNSTWAPGPGGAGARVQCVLAVTAGQVLNIIVGGAGAPGVLMTSAPGGYNNTAATGGYCSTITGWAGGGGGGASEICLGGTALANRLIVAGAGGGGGSNCTPNAGGDGGGLTGESAVSCASEYSGTGGTPTTFGMGGTYSTFGTSANGAARYGGAASTYPTATIGSAGGGGGGGYYGGGGGSWGGGGGGSSYTDPVSVTGAIHTRGYNSTGDGSVKLTLVCETPIAGTIAGNTPLCPGGSTITLTNPTGSVYGEWSSSNTAVATVGSASGLITPGVPGNTTITFTATTGCGTSATTSIIVTVNALPGAGTITGTDNVCPTYTVTLSNATSGGVWSSSNPAIATVGAGTGVVTGVSAGSATISYTVTISGCSGNTMLPFTVNGPSICNVGVNAINAAGAVSMNVHPNPSKGIFTVKISSYIDEAAYITITDVMGRVVKEVNTRTNNAADISTGVADGIYFVNAVTEHGSFHEKIFVQQ